MKFHRIRGFALVAGLLGWTCGLAFAGEPNETQVALERLQSVRADIETIRLTGLHSADEGRLLILDKSTRTTLTALETFGLGSMSTLNQYQYFIVKFRFSSQFFEFIRTQKTEPTIRHLLGTVENIRKKLGIDDEPYTKILKANLLQMADATDSLMKLEGVNGEVLKALKALRPSLGNAIALSELGDRPKAFQAAKVVYLKVKGMYAALEGLASSPGYNLALEIMGLNEFIAEYAQIREEDPCPTP